MSMPVSVRLSQILRHLAALPPHRPDQCPAAAGHPTSPTHADASRPRVHTAHRGSLPSVAPRVPGHAGPVPPSYPTVPRTTQDIPRIVTLRALEDSNVLDGLAQFTLAIEGAEISRSVILNATQIDSTQPVIALSSTVATIKKGESVSVEVRLDAQPASEVAVDLIVNGAIAIPSTLIFTPDNWQTSQIITCTANDTGADVIITATATGWIPGELKWTVTSTAKPDSPSLSTNVSGGGGGGGQCGFGSGLALIASFAWLTLLHLVVPTKKTTWASINSTSESDR